VPPPNPKISDKALLHWKEVNHFPFDGNLEDCFQHTSIHLSFTKYEMPLDTNETNRHMIDRPINRIESLISVHHQGKWVADLDILKAPDPPTLPKSTVIHRNLCGRLQKNERERTACEKRPKPPSPRPRKTFRTLN
jgi:hypothetical protein